MQIGFVSWLYQSTITSCFRAFISGAEAQKWELTNQLYMTGLQLKKLRLKKGLTLRELSIISGIHYAYISTIERGLKKPNVLLMLKSILNKYETK